MRSFSLIELLIVSAIIAVLSALLMPALSSAKLNAKDIQCVSNERQVHMALYLYCQDHDQRYPRFTSPSWQNQKDQLTMLSNYVGKLDFLRCPLANGDVINDPTQSAYFSQVISGKLQWSEYKIGDYESNLGAAPP
ncbi:MAG: type II secretion system protein, partial [Verrucomicrobiae bacterium]|nr:type II secretion system protein [Verrucomicrobiae bacterium]